MPSLEGNTYEFTQGELLDLEEYLRKVKVFDLCKLGFSHTDNLLLLVKQYPDKSDETITEDYEDRIADLDNEVSDLENEVTSYLGAMKEIHDCALAAKDANDVLNYDRVGELLHELLNIRVKV